MNMVRDDAAVAPLQSRRPHGASKIWLRFGQPGARGVALDKRVKASTRFLATEVRDAA